MKFIRVVHKLAQTHLYLRMQIYKPYVDRAIALGSKVEENLLHARNSNHFLSCPKGPDTVAQIVSN